MNKIILLLFVSLLFLTSCSRVLTKKDAYPRMYEEKPLSILVLPPINESSAADAKEYYLTTIAEPLALTGYYIFPTEVVTDIFKNEGMYDNGQIENIEPKMFKKYFNADAILIIKIKKWDTSYFILGGSVTVGSEFKLISTTTGSLLWSYSGEIKVDTSSKSSGGGLIGLAVALAETAVKTAGTDYVPIAKNTNVQILKAMPLGKYHNRHNQDQNDQAVKEDNLLK